VTFATPKTRWRRSGFTLLELVMVMMLLCVIAAMAAPSLRGFSEGRKVTTAAAQVESLGQWARTQSITRGVGMRLNVNPSDGSYWLTSEQTGGVFGTLGEEFGRVFTMPDGVTLQWYGPTPTEGKIPYIEFLPTGRTTATATIRLTDTRGTIVDVACLSPGEPLRVLTGQEMASR
jgi:prepilin-type N-terminal cleavage/methylation domain-containing protein